MEIPVRLDFDRYAPAFSAAMDRLDRAAREELERVGFDRGLAELVRLRASQLNGCAYCVDMHAKTRVPPARASSGSMRSVPGAIRRSTPSASGRPSRLPRR